MNEQQPPPQTADNADDAQLLQSAIEAARKHIATLVAGNGIHKTEVRVSEKNVKFATAHLTSTCRLIPADKEKRTPGPQEIGQKLSSRAELRPAVDDYLNRLQNNTDFQKKIFSRMKAAKFGLDGEETIPLDQHKAEFSVIEDCTTCKGGGTSPCPTCHGKGRQPCNKCGAKGKIICYNCKGLKKITDANGNEQPCSECGGFGMTPCPNCNETKYVGCPACNQSGSIACRDCKQTGKVTAVFTVDLKMQVAGRLDMPQEVSDLYQRIRHTYSDSALIKNGHLKLTNTNNPVEFKNDTLQVKTDMPVPYGRVGFSLNGKRVDGDIFGYRGAVFTDAMFIDSLVKPGISALNKIARGPMATGALFQQARAYRMIRDITDQVSTQTKGKILRDVMQKYPIGLSDKYAKAAVKFADDAVRKIMVKPRWIGCGIGVAIFGALIAAWFYLGLRPEFLSDGSANIQLFADGFLLGLGFIGIGYLIKFMTRSTLKKVLGNAPEKLPKSGDQALVGLGILIVIFLICGATSPTDPGWWNAFF